MPDNDLSQRYTLAPDDKIHTVMAYTSTNLFWGDIVVKELIRVSTWLRTNMAPDSVRIFNAKSLVSIGTAGAKPLTYPEVHINVAQIQMFHLMPPAKDPLDYDASEPNRKLEPVTVLNGPFRIDGFLRLAGSSDLAKYIEITREQFSAVYDAEVTNLMLPGMGVIRVPYLLVRQATSVFAARPAAPKA